MPINKSLMVKHRKQRAEACALLHYEHASRVKKKEPLYEVHQPTDRETFYHGVMSMVAFIEWVTTNKLNIKAYDLIPVAA